jgi:glucose-6-phosphate 1-epimerase
MVRQNAVFILILPSEHGLRERYVCVEPGFVRGFVKLEPGQEWVGQQVFCRF